MQTLPARPPAGAGAGFVRRVAGVAALAGSAVVLFGLVAGIPSLAKPLQHVRGMPFNAAFCLALLGLASLTPGAGRWRIAVWCATISLLVAGATVMQFVANVNLGIDELFFNAWPGTDPRMAPNTATAICLLSLAALAAATRWRQPLLLTSALLSSVAGAIALTAAVGYLAEVPGTYGWGQFTPTAIQAPYIIGAAALAMIADAWHDSTTPETPVPWWIGVAVAVASLSGTLVFWQALEASEHIAGHLSSSLPVLGLAFGLLGSTATTSAVEFWRRAHALARALKERNRLIADRERYLSVILDTLPVGVFFADAQGTIRLGNRAGQQIWAGFKQVGPDEYGEYKAWWPRTGERVERDQWALARAVRHGEISRDEIIDIECFDGCRKTILNTALPVDDAEGERLGAIAVIQDITERRRTEAALEERTRELERSNRDLAEFAYVASHDLQEPLRMVASYVQLLEKRYKDRLDADANDFIGFAVDGARRMQGLLTDLLAYSRAGSPQEPPDRVDLNVCAAAAVQNLDAAIRECRAAVRVERLPRVLGSQSQLTQVFQNLIGNALKFRGERTPSVTIDAVRRDAHVVVRVADNGIGMDPRHADRIFVIFQRLHERGKYPGTGIGLAICKKIVDRHGGRIWVESQPGEGATFHFTLPSKGTSTSTGATV
jgi:PAS domain S-box-containing protein